MNVWVWAYDMRLKYMCCLVWVCVPGALSLEKDVDNIFLKLFHHSYGASIPTIFPFGKIRQEVDSSTKTVKLSNQFQFLVIILMNFILQMIYTSTLTQVTTTCKWLIVDSLVWTQCIVPWREFQWLSHDGTIGHLRCMRMSLFSSLRKIRSPSHNFLVQKTFKKCNPPDFQLCLGKITNKTFPGATLILGVFSLLFYIVYGLKINITPWGKFLLFNLPR